jgi:sugar phosphate isomerase/epimerase
MIKRLLLAGAGAIARRHAHAARRLGRGVAVWRALSGYGDRAAQRGLTLALYPHVNYAVADVDHALRLCERAGHPNVRLTLPLLHRFARGGRGEEPGAVEALVARAAPSPHRVNTNGSRRAPFADGYFAATVEPVGRGTLRNGALADALDAVGYDGPVGLRGFAASGDAAAVLAESRSAWRAHEAAHVTNMAPTPLLP